MLEQNTDAVITARGQLGDPRAWDILVERWHPKLWRYVARMLVNDEKVDDVLQDTWMRVVRSLVRLREPMRFASLQPQQRTASESVVRVTTAVAWLRDHGGRDLGRLETHAFVTQHR